MERRASMRNLKIYYLPATYPCGQGARSCGRVGQTDDELQRYIQALTARLPGVRIQPIDVSRLAPHQLQRGAGDQEALKAGNDRDDDSIAAGLFGRLGPAATPIITAAGELLAHGPADPEELAEQAAGVLHRQEKIRKDDTLG